MNVFYAVFLWFGVLLRALTQKKSTPFGVLFFWLRWVIRMCSRTCRWHVHEPVRTLANSAVFSHEAGRVRRTPLPCEKMQANLSISAASEERSSIPFPRFAKAPRKLHIRCVLLPSPNRTRFAGLRFGYGVFRVKIRHKSTVILIELPCFSFCAMMNMRQRRQHSSFVFTWHFEIGAMIWKTKIAAQNILF